MTAQDKTRLIVHLERYHTPVMPSEVMELIRPAKCNIIVDGTTGEGGHSRIFLESSKADAICFDADSEMLELAKKNLSEFKDRTTFIHANYSEMKEVLKNKNIHGVDGILLDLGISMAHIKGLKRGITFSGDQPLDMRLDTTTGLPVSYYVNSLPEHEIADIIWKYGDERKSRRIAKAIIWERDKGKIETTGQLAGLIQKSIGRQGRIHPATRTFQALRIFVNRELEHLETAIPNCLDTLLPGGTLVVIAYHSLEDRIVKHLFKKTDPEEFEILTKKPLVPSEDEIHENPPSRSAKLRAMRRIDG